LRSSFIELKAGLGKPKGFSLSSNIGCPIEEYLNLAKEFVEYHRNQYYQSLLDFILPSVGFYERIVFPTLVTIELILQYLRTNAETLSHSSFWAIKMINLEPGFSMFSQEIIFFFRISFQEWKFETAHRVLRKSTNVFQRVEAALIYEFYVKGSNRSKTPLEISISDAFKTTEHKFEEFHKYAEDFDFIPRYPKEIVEIILENPDTFPVTDNYRLLNKIWNVYIHWGSVEDKEIHKKFTEYVSSHSSK
jgi:hypothetical protein